MKRQSKKVLLIDKIREELKEEGYISIGSLQANRGNIYRILTISCNILGKILNINPFHVYQLLKIRAEKSARGACFQGKNKIHVDQESLQEWERGGGLRFVCPHCGKMITGAEPPRIADRETLHQHRRGAGAGGDLEPSDNGQPPQ